MLKIIIFKETDDDTDEIVESKHIRNLNKAKPKTVKRLKPK